jgi:hypothetical protein
MSKPILGWNSPLTHEVRGRDETGLKMGLE